MAAVRGQCRDWKTAWQRAGGKAGKTHPQECGEGGWPEAGPCPEPGLQAPNAHSIVPSDFTYKT